ncbi:MAG: DUF4143 domain-containing protein [Lachnospiraceae bacterium]|nr:DUF4143 domain-containing protein [Lachnospiraceae bacterium]
MSDAGAKEILTGKSGFVEYKGAFTENYVAQLLATAWNNQYYYYVNDRNSVEIDFVIQGEQVYPIEVKAEYNLNSKSLRSVLTKYGETYGFRFSLSDYKKQERMTNVPLYLVEEWLKMLKDCKE